MSSDAPENKAAQGTPAGNPADAPATAQAPAPTAGGKPQAAPEAKPGEKAPAKKPPAKKPPAKKPAAKKPAPPLFGLREVRKSQVSDEVMVRFEDVTKTYHLYKNDKGRFLGMFGLRPSRFYSGSINANDHLSFEIRKGEAVAFLGRNGAGKSTALKIITGVTHPTGGTVEVNGRVSALLELTAGFDNSLTGRENITLRGQIMGIPAAELKELEPKIVEFADLGVFIDQPMRSYSSGMKARLGFAFAVSTDPEILVVDEALAVGDKEFKRKCLARIRQIMLDENVTVLFVTHTSSTAQQICTRGIVLDKGTKLYEGPIDDATRYYEENCL